MGIYKQNTVAGALFCVISKGEVLFNKENKAAVYAAKEFNKYLFRCLGFSLSEYCGQQHFISIGVNEKSKTFIELADKTSLKESGLRISFKDGNAYIYGGSDKGVIYGVYEFLERYLGVKFLTATDEVTPKADSVNIEEKDVLKALIRQTIPTREL